MQQPNVVPSSPRLSVTRWNHQRWTPLDIGVPDRAHEVLLVVDIVCPPSLIVTQYLRNSNGQSAHQKRNTYTDTYTHTHTAPHSH